MDYVFLLDVDNTLLDNDRIVEDLRRYLGEAIGPQKQERYWAIFEDLRASLGYADYLGALQRYRAENLHDPHFLRVSLFLMDYKFRERLFPGALDLIETLKAHGQTAILSDGDVVFQPHKVWRSGLAQAVDERVLIYIHKEAELADVEARLPAKHYVMIDDKLRLLTAIKAVWGDRVTTVYVRQGHYARDKAALAGLPAADLTVEKIADVAAALKL